MSPLPILLLVSCLSLCLGGGLRPAHAADEVRVGVLAFQGSEKAAEVWEPTINHLNRKLPPHHFVLVPFNLAGLEAAVSEGRVDFVITNPGDYVRLEATHAVTRIATLESETAGSPMAAVGSALIRRAERTDISSIRDLRGKRLAVVSIDAFGGFQVMWREMVERGIDPFDDLASIVQVGFPMARVMDAVMSGRADAGVIRACLLEAAEAEGRIPPGALTVVGAKPEEGPPCLTSSRLYPDWPFARLAHTSRDLARRVAAALLTMPAADGRAWTASFDYTSVHELFRVLHLKPHERDLAGTLTEFAWENLHWVVVAGLGVLWWIVHVARVEVLVMRRTAELQREIAEREKAEATAARLREERDQLSRLGVVGEIAGNIAHELNQPLAAITNYAHGMTRILGAETPNLGVLRSGAEQVAAQAERAAAIIQRTRALVRRRPGQRSLLDLNRVVAEALSLFGDAAERRGIRIVSDLAPIPLGVRADKVELQQVLINLLQNATDAMSSEVGPPLPAQRQDTTMVGGEIVVTTTRERDMVSVLVADDGPGLGPDAPSDAIDRMFEPYYTTKREGLGLGLSICRTIIERHGGRIWAEPASDAGRGLIVGFSLPADLRAPTASTDGMMEGGGI